MALRVTNNMIMKSANTNINGTKVRVDKTNMQMTTQQKINRPSEDPVIAVRGLRLQTSLSKIDQYYERNIPDADKWMDVTGTALTNMSSLISTMRTLAVQGSTGSLNENDRNAVLSQLKSLQEQIYHEGDADYAGRTVFTGYHTNKTLTFQGDEPDTAYKISQKLSAADMKEFRYFAGEVDLANVEEDISNLQAHAADNNVARQEKDIPYIEEVKYDRLRLAYDDIKDIEKITIKNSSSTAATTFKLTKYSDAVEEDTTTSDIDAKPRRRSDANVVDGKITDEGTEETKAAGTDGDYPGKKVWVFDTEDEWLDAVKAGTDTDLTDGYLKIDGADYKYVPKDGIVVIKSTGELIFGSQIATDLKSGKAEIEVDYNKKGFNKGELRPEYYYNSTDFTDPNFGKEIIYDKFDKDGKKLNYDINYTISQNQEIAVNLEADSVFDANIIQDIRDMIDAVTDSINAHSRLEKIKGMKAEGRYADDDSQELLSKWQKEAEREATFADDHLDKWFSSVLGNCDKYESEINLANTRLGCKQDQLKMVEMRMSEQQQTVMDLQSENDNLDLSDIILKYTAAYTAYQSSLTAAGRLGQQTLLNYI